MQASSPTSVHPTLMSPSQTEVCPSPTIKIALAIIASLGSFLFLPCPMAFGLSTVIIVGAVICDCVDNPYISLPPSTQKTRETAEPLIQPQSPRTPSLSSIPPVPGGEQQKVIPLPLEVPALKETTRVIGKRVINDEVDDDVQYDLANGMVLNMKWYEDPLLNAGSLLSFTKKDQNGLTIYCGNPQRAMSFSGSGNWYQA